MDLDWSVVTENLPILLGGIRLTLFISLVSFLAATILGVGVALARRSRLRPVRLVATAYVNVMRAIPLLVFIVFVYYGVAIAFDISFLTAIQAGMAALTLQYSAWLGEIFRSGLQAVPKGQREAALSVGMRPAMSFITVVLPQAARIVIAPTGNMLVGMLKDSSLVYLLGVPELFRQAQLLANRTFRYFEVYLATVALYLVLTLLVDLLVTLLERRSRPLDHMAAGRRFNPRAGARRERLRTLIDTVERDEVAA